MANRSPLNRLGDYITSHIPNLIPDDAIDSDDDQGFSMPPDHDDVDFLLGMDSDDEIFEILDDEKNGPKKMLKDNDPLDTKKSHFDEVVEKLKTRRKPAELTQDECEARLGALVNVMEEAAKDDELSHSMNKPCVSKLRTIPIFKREMNRPELRDGFVMANGLSILDVWLSPLEDGTKPNNTIIKECFTILALLPVSTTVLKQSDLGKTVARIFKDESVPTAQRRQAEDLISSWLRPMLNLNNSYAVMVEENQQAILNGMSPSNIIGGGLSPKAGGLSPSDLGLSPNSARTVRKTPRGLSPTLKRKAPHYPSSPASAKRQLSRQTSNNSSDASPKTPGSQSGAMVHFQPQESRHARREMGKTVNNFVALPDYELLKVRKISKRQKQAIENKKTPKNRIKKCLGALHKKDMLGSRPHQRDTVGVSALKNAHLAQQS